MAGPTPAAGGVSSGVDDAEVEAAAAAFLTASRALVGISLRSMAAAPVPLTVPQHRLLVLVSSGRPRRVGELAEHLGVNQSNASRLVDRMVVQQLVRKTRDPQDGRAFMVEPTSVGSEVLRTVTEHRMGELRHVVRQMSSVARAQAVEVLTEFNDAAHEHPGAVPGRADLAAGVFGGAV